ncbi:MAG: fasciclin domain-containing protein, partial [Planctomycetota bacterium]
ADIVDTAVSAGSFKTLAAALGAADLVTTLKGKGPFTVLAPTDEAFAKLPPGTVESLLKPENKEKLVAILTYHVIPAQVPASTVVTLSEAKTVAGAKISIQTDSSGVTINDARVVQTDIACDNGLIHVIDTVLLPPENATGSSGASCQARVCETLANAVSRGSSLYNAGHHAACADLYRKTLISVMGEEIGQEMKTHVQTVLSGAAGRHSSSDRAWALRRGIDTMYVTMRRSL